MEFSLFVFKKKTAYGMRISVWSSDVCSSDLAIIVDRRYIAEHVALLKTSPGSIPNICYIQRRLEIGRASCRERVCQYVSISGVAVKLKKNTKQKTYYVYNKHSTDNELSYNVCYKVQHLDIIFTSCTQY